MKKIIKNRIFIFITTAMLFAGIGVYGATKYKANEVLYNSSDGTSMNVNEALNDLYKIVTEKNNRYIIGTFEAGTLSEQGNLRSYNIKFNEDIDFQVKSILIVFANISGPAFKAVYKSENVEFITSSGHFYKYSSFNAELTIKNNGFSFTTQHGWLYGTAYYIAFEDNTILDEIQYNNYYIS